MDCCNDGDSISKNLQASFKVTGMFPINKQKVLGKLPNEDNTDIINDTVTTYLKSQRFSNTDENSKKKRKKLTVPSGSSITVATLGLSNVSSDEEFGTTQLL